MAKSPSASGSDLRRARILVLSTSSCWNCSAAAAWAKYGRLTIRNWTDRALKLLRAETASEFDTAHIAREAKAASALNHPNIVTIHELVRSESDSAIVMELVQGGSLAKFRGALLSSDQVLPIAAQIAKALAAAHANGIIHGDIKPENIMLRDDGYVKVLDFGLARRAAIETSAGEHEVVFGTLRYMSPEQARGESLTHASDIFSFGLVLFELAAGRRAFDEASPLDAVSATLTKDPPAPATINPRIPAALNSLILAMLAKDPARRPLATEIARQLGGEFAGFRGPGGSRGGPSARGSATLAPAGHHARDFCCGYDCRLVCIRS